MQRKLEAVAQVLYVVLLATVQMKAMTVRQLLSQHKILMNLCFGCMAEEDSSYVVWVEAQGNMTLGLRMNSIPKNCYSSLPAEKFLANFIDV